jgi:hypothetical protein
MCKASTKDNTLPYLFYTNAKTITHNKQMFENINGETFLFVAKDMHSDIRPLHFKLLIIPNEIAGLHHVNKTLCR